MPGRIPIGDLRELARLRDLRQAILVAWDGEREHVVTYGRSAEECDQAALGGDRIKAALGWPPESRGAEPSRVRRLREERDAARRQLGRVIDAWEALSSPEPIVAHEGEDGQWVSVEEMQQWLLEEMAPAIGEAREFLGRPRPGGRGET